MKHGALLVAILLLGVAGAAAQCDPHPPWNRFLPQGRFTFTWSWDENLNGAILTRTSPPVPLSNAQAVQIVKAAIAEAFRQWCAATHRISVTYAGTSGGDIKITFANLIPFLYGETQTWNDIKIAVAPDPSISNAWTDNTQIVSQGYPDIYTIFMHELTHVFLGVGHPNWSAYTVTMYDSPTVKRTLGTTCDIPITQSLYNPVTPAVTARNSFGGGSMKIDNAAPQPVPSGGFRFDSWRESTYPHALEAVDGQSIFDANTGETYVRRFQLWTVNQIPGNNINPRSIPIPSAQTEYRADFLSQFNVQLNSATLLEPGGGGQYRVDDVNVGGSWSGTILQGFGMKSEAVPSAGWFFLYWSDGQTTNPRFDQPLRHLTLSASYKAHLGSGDISGFATNSQRRLVRDDLGWYHAVYASAGSVWYSTSADNGATWTPEIRVNPSGTSGKCPSISNSVSTSHRVFIAYQTDASNGPSTPAIMVAAYNTNVQESLRSVGSIPAYAYDANPAIGTYYNTGMVVFKPTASSGLSMVQLTIAGGTISGTSIWPVQGSGAGSTNPAVAYPFNNSGTCYLVFQEGETSIQYIEWTGSSQTLPVNISSGDGCSLNRWPSLAVHSPEGTPGEKPIVSWTGTTPSTTVAVVRRRISGTWSAFTQLGGSLVGGTEVGATTHGSQQAIVGWSYSYPYVGQLAQFSRLVSNAFGTLTTLAPGQFHITNAPSFSSMKSALYYAAALPYQIRPLTYNFATLAKTDGIITHTGRQAVVGSTESEVGYILQDVLADGIPVSFTPIVDSLEATTVRELNAGLVTEPFLLTEKSSLSFAAGALMSRAASSGEKARSIFRLIWCRLLMARSCPPSRRSRSAREQSLIRVYLGTSSIVRG
jgi:hypothetical protein